MNIFKPLLPRIININEQNYSKQFVDNLDIHMFHIIEKSQPYIHSLYISIIFCMI
jgi:hypothetical protein